MSNKLFIGILAVLIAGVVGVVITNSKNQPKTERPGIAHEDKGRKHVDANQVSYDGPEPPTSGSHSEPAPWQAFNQPVPDANTIHNLEHGGVYISYRPDIPQVQIDKIQALFSEPYSRKKFTPTKAILAPRPANDAPIILSSWNRSLKLGSFNEEKMVEYYLRNVGKAPEGRAL